MTGSPIDVLAAKPDYPSLIHGISILSKPHPTPIHTHFPGNTRAHTGAWRAYILRLQAGKGIWTGCTQQDPQLRRHLHKMHVMRSAMAKVHRCSHSHIRTVDTSIHTGSRLSSGTQLPLHTSSGSQAHPTLFNII